MPERLDGSEKKALHFHKEKLLLALTNVDDREADSAIQEIIRNSSSEERRLFLDALQEIECEITSTEKNVKRPGKGLPGTLLGKIVMWALFPLTGTFPLSETRHHSKDAHQHSDLKQQQTLLRLARIRLAIASASES